MSDKSSLEVVADILDELQSFVIVELAPKAHDVIKKAAQLITDRVKDFAIPNLQFSIVYQSYRDLILNVECERGQVIPETQSLALEASALSSYQGRIETVVATGVVDRSTSNYLIVPMRLDPKVRAIDGQDLPPRRVVGAFLLESDKEYVFQEKDARLFDRFSDGCAVLIQLGDSKARTEVTNKLHSEYLGSIGQFKSELEIFKKLVDSLTNNEIRYSYAASEINILLYHSFYQGQLYIVCENGELKSDFRKENAYSFGSDKISDLFGEYATTVLDKQNNDIVEFTSSKYLSNIVVPILVHHDNKIGYLILRTQQKNAYQNEKNLLRRTAGFLATTLRSFRHDTWEQQLDKFFNKYIEENVEDKKSWTDRQLYQVVVTVLEHIYGTVELAIVNLSQEDKKPAFTFMHGQDWDEANLLTELEIYINRVNLEPFRSKNRQYYIYNITAENGRITNFVIIKMTRDSVRTTHKFIQHLLTMVGIKQSFMRKKKRLISLTKFGEAITNEPNITLERAYELAYKYIKKVMSTTNMYIALLDRKNNIISFPLFKMRNDDDKVIDMFVDARPFDPNSIVTPRTEYILKNKKMLLIDTKEESLAWYESHGNSEKIGDTLAAWIGVPIISEGQAVGVIAVYHPSTEYLYTIETDGIFLENIAIHFSSLLVRVKLEDSIANNLELSEANERERSMQMIIVEQERQLTTSLIAQDIMHGLNGNISSVAILVEEAKIDILEYKEKKKIGVIDQVISSLDKAYNISVDLLGAAQSITKDKSEDIDVGFLVERCIDQVITTRKASWLQVIFNKPNKPSFLLINKKILSSIVNSLLNNAIDAIQRAYDSRAEEAFFIEVNIKTIKNNLCIDIGDNGSPKPIENPNKIFENGFSEKEEHTGYGLWRAKSFAKSQGGDCELIYNASDKKVFRLSFKTKLVDKIKTAFIIDDQDVWRDILSKWLIKNDFNVRTASTLKEANNLIVKFQKENIVPDIVLSDISLDASDSGNVDGLKVIKTVKNILNPSFIALVTAFPEKAIEYNDMFSVIISKSSNGLPLSYKSFIKEIPILHENSDGVNN